MAQTCLIAPDVIAAYQINCTEHVRYPHRFAAYHACGVTFGSNEIICDYVDIASRPEIIGELESYIVFSSTWEMERLTALSGPASDVSTSLLAICTCLKKIIHDT